MYSNRYIFIYASVMVIIVAVVLSTVATQLKPFQQANVKLEKIQNILSAANIESTKANAFDLFAQYVTNQYIVKFDGTFSEGNAFDIDMKSEMRKNIQDRLMPLYIVKHESGETNYVIPLYGRGLWGPVWGYIALKDDFNSVGGVVFDHKSETPGLGAEISTSEFQQQFKDNKKIFDNSGQFVSVKVVKAGQAQSNPHAVDGISGGTITSDGVSEMLDDNMRFYLNYYENNIK